MNRLLYGIFLALMSVLAYGANKQPPADPATVSDTVNAIGLIIFGVVDLVIFVGFMFFVWLNEKKRKKAKREKEQK